MSIKYVYPRNGRYYFQKVIPLDLRQKYRRANISIALSTTGPKRLVRRADNFNPQYVAEFERLRGNPVASPEALKDHAKAFLKEWGLRPGQKIDSKESELMLDLLHDHLDDKRADYAEKAYQDGEYNSSDEAYNSASGGEYLNAVEVEALKLLHGGNKPTFGKDAVELYLGDSGKASNEKFRARKIACL